MYKSVLEPGELDVKTKELISIVAAVSRLCEHCLHHHVHSHSNTRRAAKNCLRQWTSPF